MTLANSYITAGSNIHSERGVLQSATVEKKGKKV